MTGDELAAMAPAQTLVVVADDVTTSAIGDLATPRCSA